MYDFYPQAVLKQSGDKTNQHTNPGERRQCNDMPQRSVSDLLVCFQKLISDLCRTTVNIYHPKLHAIRTWNLSEQHND